MKISELADQLRSIPLRDVLERYGFEVRPEGTTLRAKSEHHNIVVTGGRWFDNKAGVGGGGAIDLVIHLAGVNFSAAYRSLADEFIEAGQARLSFPKGWPEPSHPEKKSFEELAVIYAVREDSNWQIARSYLIEQRKISLPLVDELHARGSVYANNHRPNPSIVFLHRDQHGKVRGASLRDTKHQSVFRPCLGNKLTAWFAVGNVNEADRIVVVESPIDALIYYSLFGCRSGRLAVVSCAGATVPRELMLQAYDRCQAVVVALDNDAAGERGRQKAREETLNWAGFELSSDYPKLKDWNDDLIAVIPRMRAPQVQGIRIPQTMNNDPHNQVLDGYFWHFVDQGCPSATTPLFTGIYEGDSLARVIAREFGLRPHEAESIFEIARKEVAL